MQVQQINPWLESLFGAEKLADRAEWGWTVQHDTPIAKVGYATNLVPETVEKAAEEEVDLLITHHDAWRFLHGMKERCVASLKHYGISHFFVHLPLDDADFGTNVSLMKAIGATVVERSHKEGIYFAGAMGEYPEPISFDDFVARVESVLQEPALVWTNHSRPICRVGMVTGGGYSTHDVHEAVEKGCDVYVTGERVLYTVQYAQFAGINLVIGSHTFTEILGVKSLAEKLKEAFPDISLVQIHEEHLEANAYRVI